MADITVNSSDITYEYLAYPFGSFGDMLLIRANISTDMEIGDYLNFNLTNLDQNEVITVNTTANVTASVPDAGTDPVTYHNASHGIDLSSFADSNLQKVSFGTSGEAGSGYVFYPVGETDTDPQEKGAIVVTTPYDQDAETGANGNYSALLGWIALYSTKLDRYINYCTFNVGSYGNAVIYAPTGVSSNGFVYGPSPSDNVSGYVFHQLSNPTTSRCGVGNVWIFPETIIYAFYGRYGQGVLSEESVISKIFAGRDPINIDPDDPGDNTNPYGDKAGNTDGSKPITGDTGDGDFDYSTTPIPIPDLPDKETSVIGTGFVNLYHPSKKQIENLGKFLYSSALSPETIAKAYSNPMDYIEGILMLPIPAGKIPDGSTSRVYVANRDTGLDWTTLTDQWIILNCGTLTLREPTKTYLDYAPYTKLSLYLPFIGIVDLDIDDFLPRNKDKEGKDIPHTITVSYHIDLLTGAFLCYVSRGDGSTVYTYPGTCGSQLPISQASYQQTFSNLIQMGTSILQGVGAMVGGAIGGLSHSQARGMGLSASMEAGSSGASAISSSKPQIKRTGSIQGDTGILSVLYPYLIYEQPYGVWPDKVDGVERYDLTGLPSGLLVKIATLKGYTRIEAVNLTVAGAYDDEIDEIREILRTGVII